MKAAAILFLFLAFASPSRAAEITAEQEAELTKLRDSLWDQGLTEAEIRKELDTQRARMQGPSTPTAAAKEAPSPLEKLKASCQRLQEKGIIPAERAGECASRLKELESAWPKMPLFERMKRMREARYRFRLFVKEWWRGELVRSGMPLQEANKLIVSREAEAWRMLPDLLREGLSEEELARELKRRLPDVPAEFFDLADTEPEAEPASAAEPEPAPALSDDEIDQIVDEMMKELEQAPLRK